MDTQRRPILLGLLLSLSSLGLSACAKAPSINVVVTLPSSLASQGSWVELGLFHEACPVSASALLDGIPTANAVRFVRFSSSSTSPPLGNLPSGTYSLMAALRDSSCRVIATGCASSKLDSAETVSVALSAGASPSGGCSADQACSGGQCVPNPSPSSFWGDAGCVLQVLGGGPLPDPMAGFGEQLASPAVAAVDGGFVIGLREYDPIMGNTQLSVLGLDTRGALLNQSKTPLGSPCPSLSMTDGIGITFDSSGGLIASARPGCNASGGIDFARVSTAGNILATAFASSSATTVSLSDAHSLGGSPSGISYLAVLLDGVPNVSSLQNLAVSPAVTFSGGASGAAAWAAANTNGTALLAASPSAGTLDLTLLPPGTKLTGGISRKLAGTTAALSVSGSSVFILPFDPASSTATLSVADLITGAPGPSLSFTAPFSSVMSADVSADGEHLAAALAGPKAIVLYAAALSAGSVTLLSSLSLADAPHVPSLLGLRDGAAAVAASAEGAIVVWTTSRNLQSGDNLGGYAVVGCVN